MIEFGAVAYLALIAIAGALGWLALVGHSWAGYVLVFWVGSLVVVLPGLGVIPQDVLLTIYSLTCFCLILLLAALAPGVIKAAVQNKDLRRLLHASNKKLDEERRKLTSAIHDDINPQLILAKMETTRLSTWIKQSGISHDQSKELLGLAENCEF